MKSVFIIAIVAIAMIGVMVPSSFADHPEVAIVTVDESGFSQTCAESQGGSGCYTPVTATVDVGGVVTMTNTDPTGVHTFTSGTVNGFAPSPDGTFDSSILRSGNSFEWIPTQAGEVQYYCILHTWMIGTIIVQEAHAAEEVIEEDAVAEEVSADVESSLVEIEIDDDLSTDITFKTTKPDGSPGNYPGGVNTGKPAYIVDNKIDSANNLVYGTWTLQVCAPEYDMCVEESFTIDEPVTLPDDGATQTEKVVAEEKSTEEGGGCLIATATYGSEMASRSSTTQRTT